jgi:cyanophycinase-like exopeptidase
LPSSFLLHPDTALYSEEVDAECKGLLGKGNNCHIIFFLGLDARKMKAISSDTTLMGKLWQRTNFKLS